jgi:hypothetical protein
MEREPRRGAAAVRAQHDRRGAHAGGGAGAASAHRAVGRAHSVILTQISVGRSLKASMDYLVSTFGGAIYAGAIGAFVPHDNSLAVYGALALAAAVLLAALNARVSCGQGVLRSHHHPYRADRGGFRARVVGDNWRHTKSTSGRPRNADDQPFRESMKKLVTSLGYIVEAFPSAADFPSATRSSGLKHLNRNPRQQPECKQEHGDRRYRTKYNQHHKLCEPSKPSARPDLST